MRYELYHNEVLVYSGLDMIYAIAGLSAYSLNSFRVTACTVVGCGSSELVQARTREAVPQGYIVMQLKVAGPRYVKVRWDRPEFPNGEMVYNVYFEGLFYTDPGRNNDTNFSTDTSSSKSVDVLKLTLYWCSVLMLVD